MPDLLSRFREIVQQGDEDAFQDAMNHFSDQPIPPASLVERHERREEKRNELAKLHPDNWPPERKRCGCGAYYVGSECGHCARAERVLSREPRESQGTQVAI